MAGLTVAQLREHVTTALVDAAVQRLLDAAWLAITSRFGEIGTLTDTRIGYSGLIQLSRRAASISSVDEVFTLDVGQPADVRGIVLAGDVWFEANALATDDYSLDESGFWLQRLATGTNPSDVWGQAVRVTYVAFDDTAERLRVQMELVQLDLAYRPGVQSETIGTWTEQLSGNSAWNYQVERDAILASLSPRAWRFA